MGLQAKLDAYKEGMVKKAPKEALDIMHQATEDLRNSTIMEGVVKVGEAAPEFIDEKKFTFEEFNGLLSIDQSRSLQNSRIYRFLRKLVLN